MWKRHVIKELSAYCHGELTAEQSRRVAEHLLSCLRCRQEFEEIKVGISLIGRLPLFSAPASMWNQIEPELEVGARNLALEPPPKSATMAFAFGWPRLAVVSILCLLFLGTFIWLYTHPVRVPYENGSKPSWKIARLTGTPKVGAEQLKDIGRLKVGEWLETDASSSAKIDVADIGIVEIEPNTRIQLVGTHELEHRLALAIGTMHAIILAPPRQFVVETPSAVAVDLGCRYTLTVDKSGGGILSVSYGWVAFEFDGRESFVPEGGHCETRAGIGPGTPFFIDASETFRYALKQLDFEAKSSIERATVLNLVLAESRQRDAFTFWHLLSRLKDSEKSRVYDRLAALVSPPNGVTKEGVLSGDKQMLDLWWNQLGLGDTNWWRKWKGPWPPQPQAKG